ncbi:hypothetical protein LguiA_032324 [Lonicera macranthoides]
MGSSSVPVAVSVSASSGPKGHHNVFVYGSLLADDVVRALLNRIPHSSPAVLNDLYSIKGRVYPAILPVEKKKVNGRVLLGITDPELNILDAFEDFEYERRIVDVSLMGRSENLQANAYVWSNSSDPNLYGEWDFEAGFLYYCIAGTQTYDLQVQVSVIYHWLDSNLGSLGSGGPRSLGSGWGPLPLAEEWKRQHMKDFVKMTMGFVEELELPDSKPRVATYESFYQQNASN